MRPHILYLLNTADEHCALGPKVYISIKSVIPTDDTNIP